MVNIVALGVYAILYAGCLLDQLWNIFWFFTKGEPWMLCSTELEERNACEMKKEDQKFQKWVLCERIILFSNLWNRKLSYYSGCGNKPRVVFLLNENVYMIELCK